MSEIIISIFLLIGAWATLTGVIGLNRFPDVYNRMHATGKVSTMGLLSTVIAVTIYFIREWGFTLKPLLVVIFLFGTAPLGAFLIGRAAHRTGPNLAAGTVIDDMKGDPGPGQPFE